MEHVLQHQGRTDWTVHAKNQDKLLKSWTRSPCRPDSRKRKSHGQRHIFHVKQKSRSRLKWPHKRFRSYRESRNDMKIKESGKISDESRSPKTHFSESRQRDRLGAAETGKVTKMKTKACEFSIQVDYRYQTMLDYRTYQLSEKS